eukprot:1226828-Rhodomonas_salina.1
MPGAEIASDLGHRHKFCGQVPTSRADPGYLPFASAQRSPVLTLRMMLPDGGPPRRQGGALYARAMRCAGLT